MLAYSQNDYSFYECLDWIQWYFYRLVNETHIIAFIQADIQRKSICKHNWLCKQHNKLYQKSHKQKFLFLARLNRDLFLNHLILSNLTNFSTLRNGGIPNGKVSLNSLGDSSLMFGVAPPAHSKEIGPILLWNWHRKFRNL